MPYKSSLGVKVEQLIITDRPGNLSGMIARQKNEEGQERHYKCPHEWMDHQRMHFLLPVYSSK